MKILALVLLLSSTACAGQSYYTPPRVNVIYVVPGYRPTVSRGINWGVNKAPYNPVYTTHKTKSKRSYSRVVFVPTGRKSGRASSRSAYNPNLVINPYVNQTPYKGLGR